MKTEKSYELQLEVKKFNLSENHTLTNTKKQITNFESYIHTHKIHTRTHLYNRVKKTI